MNMIIQTANTLKAILTTLGNLANAAGVLTNDGAGVLSWEAAGGGGYTLVETLTTNGAGSYTTSVDLSAYSSIFLVAKGVSHATTTKDYLLSASTNGSAFGSTLTWLASATSGNSYYGVAYIPANLNLGVALAQLQYSTMSTAGSNALVSAALALNAAGKIMSLKIATSGGNFDAGTVGIWVR